MANAVLVTLPDTTAVPFDDTVTPWRAWSPATAAARLSPVRTSTGRPVRWAVAGGWAVDLHLGHVTRPHSDLEVTTLAADSPAVLAAFPQPAWRWAVPAEGSLHPLSAAEQVDSHQAWLWSEHDHAFVLDVFREPHRGDTWVCRRDESITRPWSEMVEHTADGVPHIPVEVVLLFKAKHLRPKDVHDFDIALPTLDERRRAWLRDALQRVHPGHGWLARL